MKARFKYLVIAMMGLAINWTVMSSLTAQTEQLGPLLSVSEFTVKPGHEMQFREGVKAWKACYLENNGDWTWRLWQRQQGPGNVFTLASNMVNWAEMDKADEAGKNCQDLVRTLINPHIESGSNHISRFQPESSITAPLSGDIIRVAFYKLNPQNGHKMMETVKEVLAIRKSANIEPLGYWYQWLTSDPESPNYHHVMPYTDYAAMDIQQEGVWDTVEKNAGKEKRDELQAAFRSSLENSWIYIYKLDKDLSRPTK